MHSQLRHVWVLSWLLVVPWAWGGSTAAADPAPGRDWRKVIDQCISKVEKSDAVFYRRGERATGKQLARQMREYLNVVLRVKSVPDPFGRNAGVVLAILTTHEGIAFDGITGPPEPCEVEVGGQRMKVYDWLKKELGLERLPGEEPGHEVLETKRYETDLTPELSLQWERYIDKCIEVVRGAKDVTFLVKGQIWSAADVAVMMESNRSDVIRFLKTPELDDDEKKDYKADWAVIELTSVPQPKRESYPDQEQYSKAVKVWATKLDSVKKPNGIQEPLSYWVQSTAGAPPRMPKLKKKGKQNGQQDHWTERGRATSVCGSVAVCRPRRSVLRSPKW